MRSSSSTSRKKPSSRAKKPTPAETAVKALKEYEDALKNFRKGDYGKSIPQFEKIVKEYPIEREIRDRARIWLKMAQARAAGEPKTPSDPDDLYYQGVLALNAQEYDAAIGMFEKVVSKQPDSDKAHYGLASVCGRRGDAPGAAAHLSKAIKINASNRIHALNDPDFDLVREDTEITTLLGGSPQGDV